MKLPGKLLRIFIRPELVEEILGDLEEQYKLDARTSSERRAKFNYWIQTLNYLRPFALKQRRPSRLNHMTMLINNLKVGFRQSMREKTYSAIKLGGLALGIAASALIGLFVYNETSYDRHLIGQDKYRVFNTEVAEDGTHDRWVWMEAPWARTAKEEFPEIELVGRVNPGELWGAGGNQLRRDDRAESNYEEGFVYSDQEILEIFNAKMVYGDINHCLDKRRTMVITKTISEKYFPNEDPVGKVMIVNDNPNLTFSIGGVIEDWPVNSHFQYQIFMTLEGMIFYEGEQDNWGANNYPTYVKLRAGTDPNELAGRLHRVFVKYALPFLKARGSANVDEDIAGKGTGLQPVEDIHLRNGDISDPVSHGDIRFVWLFGAVAIFIILIAVVNFINLSTARSANRAKEVGLRKAVGSGRGSIAGQFMVESLLFSFASYIVGLALAWLLLPSFSTLAARNLTIPWQEWWLIPVLIAAAFLTGIFAGSYPSFYLSAFKPINVLRGNLGLGPKKSYLRNTLVVFQFAITVILIISTGVIHRQMQFILTRDIGFDRDHVVLIQGTSSIAERARLFKEELLRLPAVKSVTVGNYLPVTGGTRNQNTFFDKSRPEATIGISGQSWRVDHDYIKTMGMRLALGRDFSREFAADSVRGPSMIINQRMAGEFGFKDPIGQTISNGNETWTIIGVVEDIQTRRDHTENVALSLGNNARTISVKLSTSDYPAALSSIENVWKQFAPSQPIRYTFLDDSFERMYNDVQRTGYIFTCFAVLAIVVACLGLFGLSAYIIEQRSKEISIRLVLGASMRSIFGILTSNFVGLVAVSIIIAAPIGWWLMNEWLKSFEYRMPASWDVFVLAGILSVAIALVTISFHAIKAGTSKPVDGLRRE
jgi:putative ABC transport system permease protein